MLWILLPGSLIYKNRKGKKREEIINKLAENVSRLAQKVDNLSAAVKKQEQYSRCQSLLIQRILVKKQENYEELCIKAINKHLDLAINDRDIDGTNYIA